MDVFILVDMYRIRKAVGASLREAKRAILWLREHILKICLWGIGCIYRTDKIQCYFPLLSQGEDTAWYALNMYYWDLVLSVSSTPTYYYRYNNTSITRTKGFSLKKFTDSAKALFCYMILFREYGSLSDSASIYRLYDAYLKFRKYDDVEFASAIRMFFCQKLRQYYK